MMQQWREEEEVISPVKKSRLRDVLTPDYYNKKGVGSRIKRLASSSRMGTVYLRSGS